MKHLLTILLFTLTTLASFAQGNPNSGMFAYKSMAQAIMGPKKVGFRFDVMENGRTAHFIVAKRSATVVPDGGLIFALADSVNAAVRDIDQSEGINLQWFGVVPDFNPITNTGTDNYQAFLRVIASIKSGNPTTLGFPTQKMYLPYGQYYCSKQLDIKKTIWLEGEGSNYTLQSTIIWFGQDQNGFVFHRTNTPVGTTNRRGSDGSVMKHLTIAQVQPSHYGTAINERAGIYMEDCTISTWGGIGVRITAGVGSTTDKSVRNIIMNDVGDSFHAVPTVTITDLKGTGSGATATAVLGGKIWKFVLQDSGKGYVKTVKIRTGVKPEDINEATAITTGMGGAAKAIMGVDSITLLTGGQNYHWAAVRPSDSLRKGSAKFHANIVNGVITSISIDSSGGGGNSDNVYDTTFTEDGIIIDSSGYGYSSLPRLYIDGDGTGATAEANTLKVVSISLLQPGWGYETDTVPIYFMGTRLNNKGRMATGYALVSPYKFVKRVVINTPGNNYDSIRVTFSGGTPSSNAYAEALRGIDKIGNANLFRMINVRFYQCAYGVYTDGTDANAGKFDYCRFNQNRLWGTWEHAFLGNGYDNCLWSGNKAGAFAATNNTAWQALFANPYTESGQPASVAVNPVRVVGGSNGTPYYGNSTNIDAVNNAISRQTGLIFTEKGSINEQTVSLGGDVDKKQVLSVSNSYVNDINKFQATYDTTGDFVFKTATGHLYMTMNGPYSNNKFNRTAPAPFTTYFNNLMIGSSIANGRLFTNSPSFPPALPNDMNEWSTGDFVLNRSGVISGVLGWRRITTGTSNFIGVDWEEFKTATVTAPITYKNSVVLDPSNNFYIGDSGRVLNAVAGQYSAAKLPPGAVYETQGSDQTGAILFKMPWTFSMGCDFIVEGVINTRAKGMAAFKITSRFQGSNTFATPVLDYLPDSNLATIKIRLLKDASNAPYIAFYDTASTISHMTYIRIENATLLGNTNATMGNAAAPWTTSLVTSLTPYTVLNTLTNSAVTTVANGGTSNTSYTANTVNFYDGFKIRSSGVKWDDVNKTMTVPITAGANTDETRITGRKLQFFRNNVLANGDFEGVQMNFIANLLLASQKQLQFTSYDNTVQSIASILASPTNTLDFVVNSVTGMSLTSAGHAIFNGTIKPKVYTVATLPTPSQSMLSFVNDALTPVNGSTVVGGGGVPVPVYYNGTNWIVMGSGTGASASSYHLPYNGISTNYLGGDSALHPLPILFQRSGTTISPINAGDSISTTGKGIFGSFRMADGTQGAGKTIISDAGGNGTWQTPYSRFDVTTASATVPDITGFEVVVLVNYTGGTSTITLPAASSNQGKKVVVKTITANTVVITPVFASDANTIGASSYGAYTYYSNGTTWYYISRN